MVDSLIMGVGFGLSAAFYKSLAMDFDLDHIEISSIANLLLDFRTLGYIATYGIAFLYSQVSFSRGRALFIIPFSAAVGAAVPTLAGVLVFSEAFRRLPVYRAPPSPKKTFLVAPCARG